MINTHSNYDAEIKKKWALELYDEHGTICYQYKLRISAPVIDIVKSKSFFGRWDPLYRRIEISTDLINNHCWNTVVDVFKHEIAHQIVTDIYGENSGDHGEKFHSACDLIGLPLEFRKASGDLPRKIVSWKEQKSKGKNHELLRKVEKLFALAKSPNENEAMLAMEKAQELLIKHNIQEVEGRMPGDYVYLIINPRKKIIDGYRSRICSILREHYFVKIVYSNLYDAESCETHKTIELLGTSDNVLIAEYVYYYLLNTLDGMWKDYQKKNKNYQYKKRSYLLGALHGFDQKLAQIKENQVKNSGVADPLASAKSLLLLEDKKLNNFVKKRFPKLVTSQRGPIRFNEGAYHQGASDGHSIVIHKGINQNDGNKGRFLN